MFCRSLFVPLSFFFRLLCCLSFDLRILISPFVSSNFSLILTQEVCVYITKMFSFTSSECKDNIRVTNKLLSGYHHGRGNIKPASKYLTLRNLQFLNHVIIVKTKVLLTQV